MESEEKICKNCKHLFISGMLKSWGETSGYCNLINLSNRQKFKHNDIPKAKVESIKSVTDSCDKFEK